MHNHDQKVRDMSRSVLPSAARKMARSSRRHIHHADRQDLAAALGLGDDAPRSDRRRELGNLVADRRGADKVAPLLRWARHRVRSFPGLSEAPLHEQVEHFRQLLPDTKIGRHAVSHIAWALELDHPSPPYRWHPRPRVEEGVVPLAPVLRFLLEGGHHGELNRRLKVAGLAPLHGLHEADAYAAAASVEGRAVVLGLAGEVAAR